MRSNAQSPAPSPWAMLARKWSWTRLATLGIRAMQAARGDGMRPGVSGGSPVQIARAIRPARRWHGDSPRKPWAGQLAWKLSVERQDPVFRRPANVRSDHFPRRVSRPPRARRSGRQGRSHGGSWRQSQNPRRGEPRLGGKHRGGAATGAAAAGRAGQAGARQPRRARAPSCTQNEASPRRPGEGAATPCPARCGSLHGLIVELSEQRGGYRERPARAIKRHEDSSRRRGQYAARAWRIPGRSSAATARHAHR